MKGTQYDFQKVARVRKEAGLTQEQLADELGVTSVHISRVETGVSASFDLLARIAQRFGKGATYFLYSKPVDDPKNFSTTT